MSNQDNRVLCRQNARNLTQQEIENISGGWMSKPTRDVTTTFCTIVPTTDGDDD